MKRASKGYTGMDTPLFQTMLVQADEAASTGVDVRNGGAATTVSSLDTGQSSGNIDKTPAMPYDSPLPRVHTFRSDDGRMQHNKLMDLVTKLSDKVVSLETDLHQTKKVYGAAYTKLIKKVKRLEDKLNKSRRKRRLGRKIAHIDDDEGITLVQMGVQTQGRHDHEMEADFEFTTTEDVSTANVPVSTTGAEISTASPKVKIASVSFDDVAAKGLVYIRRSATKRKDKGKAIMEEFEPTPTKTKIKQEQERLGFEEAQRLQEQFDEEERQRITSIHEEASTFKPEEWDNIQAQIEADEELTHKDNLPNKELNKGRTSLSHRLSKGLICVTISSIWEVYTEASRMYWKIIRVGNHTKVCDIFEDMLKNFDRDDLVRLWSLIHERFNSTEPTEDKEKELWVELKRLFEPIDDDELWKSQRYMHDPLI
ncbi:hypothetical protein Tco_1364896 [Tanacetum coccineum]